jgi:NTE family protein
MPNRSPPKTALILAGGGARAAYQVGVLSAVRELLPDPRHNPFPIICAASTGAINAAFLATCAKDFGDGVNRLREIWENLHAGDVYRADPFAVAGSGARWLAALAFSWFGDKNPRSLLDNTPLHELLRRTIDLNRIEEAITDRALHAVSITCSGYASGESVSFFEGRPDLEPWRRTQRIGAHVRLTMEHLLASAAIPFVFPAVKLNREFFGDGAMRQLAPISPAIHLGADRIMVIGAERLPDETVRRSSNDYPSLAETAGHALSSIFLDPLTVDLERIKRINGIVSLIPEEIRQAKGISLRSIDVLHISPSQPFDQLAALHADALPWPIRALLRGIGAKTGNGGVLTSYLLFERPYTQALIELGYQDTMARREEVKRFLGAGGSEAPVDTSSRLSD